VLELWSWYSVFGNGYWSWFRWMTFSAISVVNN